MNFEHNNLFIDFSNQIKAGTKNLLFISILLLIILPPIGVLWFVLLGWYTLIRRLVHRKRFPLNVSTFFYLGISLSATVALLTVTHLSALFYIPIPVLLLGYYGIYLFIFEEVDNVSEWFSSYKLAMILGGLYIFLFSEIVKWGKIKFSFPFDDLFGRALLGSPPTPRLYGSTFNPNFAAYFILIMIGFGLAYLLKAIKARSYGMMILFIVLVALGWTAMLDTGSRSAFIGMLILFFLALVRLSWKISSVAAILVLIRLHWFVQLIPRKGMIDLSYSNRIIIWKNSLKIFRTHPIFGVSPAGFSVFYKHMTHKYVPHSHDIFIAFLSEYGIVGEFVFLIFVGVFGSYYLKMILAKTTRGQFTSTVFMLTLPIILITGLLDHPLFSPQVALPTVILLAFFHRYVTSAENHPPL